MISRSRVRASTVVTLTMLAPSSAGRAMVVRGVGAAVGVGASDGGVDVAAAVGIGVGWAVCNGLATGAEDDPHPANVRIIATAAH